MAHVVLQDAQRLAGHGRDVVVDGVHRCRRRACRWPLRRRRARRPEQHRHVLPVPRRGPDPGLHDLGVHGQRVRRLLDGEVAAGPVPPGRPHRPGVPAPRRRARHRRGHLEGSGRPTSTWRYMVGYGQDKITGKLRVDAPASKSTLALDPAKSWMLEVKAYNDNGGSGALTGYEPVWTPATTPAPVTTPSAPATPEPSPSNAPVVVTAPAEDTTTPATESPAVEPTTTTDVVSTGPDRTPPTITATLSQPPVNGWFRRAGHDPLQLCRRQRRRRQLPGRHPDRRRQRGPAHLRTAVDGAGNTATSTMTLKLDRTPPTITATVVGTPNAAGWYISPPVIRYTCTDEVATISTCPADTPRSASTAPARRSSAAPSTRPATPPPPRWS